MDILRKYGAATTVLVPLIDRGTLDFESTPVTFAAGDTKISKDEGAFANTGSNPAHEGNGMYSLALTATEMQAARIMITIIDQTATKLWEDQAIIVDTYGNASAQHAFDLDLAEQTVALSAQGKLDVNAEADTALTDYDPATKAEMDTGHGLLATEAKQDVIDTVVDAIKAVTDLLPNAGALSDLATILVDTNELQIDDVPGLIAALNDPTVAAIADAVWDELQSGHVAAGSFGELATEIAAILVDTGTTLQAELDGIQADTEDMQTRLPAALVSGRMDASVGAMAAAVLTAAALAADAGNEVADAVLQRAISNVEPGAGARTLYGAIAQLVNRAKLDASGDLVVYKTDDSTVLVTIVGTQDASLAPTKELDPP